ncbi:phage tail spike protein [Siminovitchia fordii]|uniref:Peptidase S74 domain-containing protein n=1 Tax=Siminovitchia fordii TaxID=254759 RepID=A0ABQ4KD54_9BACI|nr:phage tail spike protein [Siminovitchia fordii]GIN23130.1 hypothetical protein J1TS3_42640 [Siminovitchia fordii]
MSFLTEKLEPQRLELFLAKPNKTVIGNLHHIKNERLKLKHGEVNELSFTLPYEVVMRNKLARNPHIDNIREKFFIKMKLGEIEEWFIITKLSKKVESTDDLDVQCFSLGYQLSYQRMIDYAGKSLNCLQVLTDCLKGTSWKVGYINPDFNLKHRQFDVSSKSKLEFLYEIAETFEGVVKFDTINSKINIYKEEEISQHKGFWIEEGKYLESIESITDADEIVTRLFVKGSDNLTINSVNPTGQSYIDDFSYFLSPFEMDEDGNITSHSYFMEDELCIAIINYNKMASSLKGEFAKLLDEKKSIQLRKTEAEYRLNQLSHELTLILDRLDVAKKLGEDTSQIILERDRKQSEIKNQKQLIESINKSIESVDKKIDDLKHQLNIENHLSEKLLHELTNFIQVAEWLDDNQIDPNDLYEEALKHIKTVNSPPINLKVNIVNFFEMTTESHNWNRLNVGDVVKIKHKKLNIWVTAKIIELEFDFESATIDISISNVKEIETAKNKIKKLFYTVDRVDTDYNARKTDWIKMTHNYNLRNDRIKDTPVNPHSISVSHEENDDGSASLNVSWSYPNYAQTEKNEDNIDGFILYLYSDVDDTPYIFGSRMANETVIPEIHFETRAYTFPSVPGNRYYTLGVRAYRRVDPDINSDQIIFSDIVSLDKPYLPTTKINFKGKINGSSYTVAFEKDKPKDPDEGDIWVSKDDAKTRVWVNNDWKEDKAYQESKDYTDKIIGERESEIRKEVEEALKEVDEAMERVDSEMERIQNEVIPEIEQALKDTYIPRQDTPPDPAEYKLWWDTSVDPPRFMQYDETKLKWVPVAHTEDEINQIIEDMRNSIVTETREYTEEEIRAVKQLLLDDLSNRIGNVNARISDLNTVTEGLKIRADSTDLVLSEQGGKINTIETTVDEVKGQIITTITNIEAIDGVVQSHSASLQAQADLIAAKVDDLTYQRDKSGILSSIEANATELSLVAEGLHARVTKEEFDSEINNVKDRVATTEATLSVQAGLIEAKAEKSEVYTRTQTDGLLDNKVDTTVYNNKVGELTTSIDNVTARVSNTETNIDTLSGNMTSALNQIAQLDVRADGIVQSVSEIRAEFNGLESGSRNLLIDSSYFTNWKIFNAELSPISDTNEIKSYNSIEFLTGNKNGASITSDFTPVSRNQTYIAQATIERLEGQQDSFILGVLAYDINKDLLDEEVLILLDKTEDANGGSYISSYKGLLVYGDNRPNDLWGKFSVTDPRVAYVRVRAGAYRAQSTYTSKVRVSNVLLEKGNVKSADWTPAPEDIDARITSTEASITTLAGKIELKASQTEVDSLAGRMTATESRINVLPNEIDLAVTQGIEHLEIGGRNLLFSTADFSAPWIVTGGTKHTIEGKIWIESPYQWNVRQEVSAEVKSGDTYSFSSDIRNDHDVGSRAYILVMCHDKNGNRLQDREPRLYFNVKSKEVNRFNGQFIVPNEATKIRIYMLTDSGYSSILKFAQPKLAKGNKTISDWTPAPEDQVDKTNVLSSINLSNEGVKIQGSKIDIAGLVSVLNADGTAGTLINGNKIVTGSIIANRLNVNEIFGNSAVIAKIQSDSVLTANLSATKITTGTLNAANVSIVNLSASSIISGTLDASKVNVANLNASNIKSGTLTAIDISGVNIYGSTISSSDKTSQMQVVGGTIELQNSSGQYIVISPDGLSGHNSGGGVRFQANQSLVTSAALGTSNSNVYIAPVDWGEARVVSFDSIPGGGSATDYTYRPIRAQSFISPPTANAYIGTDGELRVQNAGTSGVYRNVRANGYYGNFIDAHGGGTHIYARPATSDGELRVTTSGSTGAYRDVRARNFAGVRVGLSTAFENSVNFYVTTAGNGEVRVVSRSDESVYRPIRASEHLPPNSTRETKKQIERYEENSLDTFRNTSVYTFLYKYEEDDRKKHLGVMLDEIPEVIHASTGDTLEMYSMSGYLWKGVKDVVKATDDLRDDIEWLKIENQYLRGKILELEKNIKQE